MTRRPVVPEQVLRRIVRTATQAPSVHNTQPWLWRGSSHGLDLRADQSRQLPATDPDGRNLVISCGAALHHARVVAAALGWSARVTRLPDARDPDLLARIVLSPASPAPDGIEVLDAVARRCTDRRRFTSWPVPDALLAQLADVAAEQGTSARALTDAATRLRAERLVRRAAEFQSELRAASVEHEAWLDRPTADGIPAAVLEGAGVVSGAPRTRFESRRGSDLEGQDVQLSDGLVVISGPGDDPASWVRAGEGLSALWLAATGSGLSVVPLSQVIEVASTRAAFRDDVLSGTGHPLVLTRIGWQAIGRSELTRTPRRAVSEVLRIR
jgi:nitroreductase